MYNEEKDVPTSPERESLYFGIIGECRKRIDGIRNKVAFNTSPQVESVKNAESPTRTELESALKGLLEKIRDLEKDIII